MASPKRRRPSRRNYLRQKPPVQPADGAAQSASVVHVVVHTTVWPKLWHSQEPHSPAAIVHVSR